MQLVCKPHRALMFGSSRRSMQFVDSQRAYIRSRMAVREQVCGEVPTSRVHDSENQTSKTTVGGRTPTMNIEVRRPLSLLNTFVCVWFVWSRNMLTISRFTEMKVDVTIRVHRHGNWDLGRNNRFGNGAFNYQQMSGQVISAVGEINIRGQLTAPVTPTVLGSWEVSNPWVKRKTSDFASGDCTCSSFFSGQPLHFPSRPSTFSMSPQHRDSETTAHIDDHPCFPSGFPSPRQPTPHTKISTAIAIVHKN